MPFCESLCALNKTTEAFMCLKYVLFCIYIARSGRLSLLCGYFFLHRLYVLILEQKRLYVLMGHVLLKNECMLISDFEEEPII